MSFNFDINQNHYFFKNNNSVPLVFIHGVGLNQKMWLPQINYFNNETILTYDLLGHGKTSFNKKNLFIEDFRVQLNNLLNNLSIKEIHLIGFSIGSLIFNSNENFVETLILWNNSLNSVALPLLCVATKKVSFLSILLIFLILC